MDSLSQASPSSVASDGGYRDSYSARLRAFGGSLSETTGTASALAGKSDADLNAVGQKACAALRAGTNPYLLSSELGSEYTSKEGSLVVMTAGDMHVGLCPDQQKTLDAAILSGPPTDAVAQ
ncbi:hypothetical protein GCM10009665_56970 [Kitasatospora nipponensis]|uniref:DUF732 domain-containing protein n=1 Tax=Kitasatospora nipponensis TaxID=258049 RepID=A0ABP4HCI8_9ACTN